MKMFVSCPGGGQNCGQSGGRKISCFSGFSIVVRRKRSLFFWGGEG